MPTLTTQQRREFQSEVVVDHNNVKQLFHMYKKATSKEEKGTLVNTSPSDPVLAHRFQDLVY